MKRARHTPEQIVSKVREADATLAAGRPVAQIVQHMGVSEPTFSRQPLVQIDRHVLSPCSGLGHAPHLRARADTVAWFSTEQSQMTTHGGLRDSHSWRTNLQAEGDRSVGFSETVCGDRQHSVKGTRFPLTAPCRRT
jgi:hypothetical protein